MKAALFPGQGSQQVEMGRYLFDNFPVAKETFEEACDTLKLDFKKLCFDGPDEDLQLTENTQPALLLVSTATHRSLNEIAEVKYDYFAGHSVGEYAACVAAGSMKFSEALVAVRKRGEFMQSAVPVGEGAMTAVMGLSPEEVTFMCEWAVKESGEGPIEPANFNAPGQIVCSGSKKAIDWLQSNIKKEIFAAPPKRLKLIPLKVSAPFHCSMMKPAQEKMEIILNDIPFENSTSPIVQNVTASGVSDGGEIRNNLITQVSSPVRWVESLETLSTSGVSKAIELGNGQVIKGLVKKTLGDKMEVYTTNNLDELKAIETTFA